MKYLTIIMFVVLLTSCSIVPPKYDTNQYMIVATIETHSYFLMNDCLDPEKAKKRVNLMVFQGELLNTYTYYLPDNNNAHDMANVLVNDMRELQKRYQDDIPSSMYCQLKAKTLTLKTRRVLQALGAAHGVE